MPKGQTRQIIDANLNFLYDAAEELPWDAIESATGTEFSKEEREQIFDCTETYSIELSFLEAGSATSALSTLEKRVLRLAAEAIEIAEIYNAFDRPTDMADAKQKALIDLTLMNVTLGSGPSFHLMEELRYLADIARRITDNLQAAPQISYEVTSRESTTDALAHFIAKILQNASRSPARSKQENAYEYWRWGLPVGPRSTRFLKFVNIVLQLDLDLGQLKRPFSMARQLAGFEKNGN